jgi:hypothetical protein
LLGSELCFVVSGSQLEVGMAWTDLFYLDNAKKSKGVQETKTLSVEEQCSRSRNVVHWHSMVETTNEDNQDGRESCGRRQDLGSCRFDNDCHDELYPVYLIRPPVTDP